MEQPSESLYFRKGILDSLTNGDVYIGVDRNITIPNNRQIYPVNVFCFSWVSVITQLIINVCGNKRKARKSHRKSKNIYNRENFIFLQISPRDFEIILYHGFKYFVVKRQIFHVSRLHSVRKDFTGFATAAFID